MFHALAVRRADLAPQVKKGFGRRRSSNTGAHRIAGSELLQGKFFTNNHA